MIVLIFMRQGIGEEDTKSVLREVSLRGLDPPIVIFAQKPFFRLVLFWEFTTLTKADFVCLANREYRIVDRVEIIET